MFGLFSRLGHLLFAGICLLFVLIAALLCDVFRVPLGVWGMRQRRAASSESPQDPRLSPAHG